MYLKILSVLVLLSLSPLSLADNEALDSSASRLVGTDGYDVYSGGDGADTFVIDVSPGRPDWIVDFDPSEGDQLELLINDLGLGVMKESQFSLSRKGVVSLQIETDRIPLVDIGRGDLRLELDSRRGNYFLKFKRQLGANNR